MKTPRKKNRGFITAVIILAAIGLVSSCFVYAALQKKKITGQQSRDLNARQSETTP